MAGDRTLPGNVERLRTHPVSVCTHAACIRYCADHCIWHDCGMNLSRRQSVEMAGAPADQARVCLAVPPPALATLWGCAVDERSA